MSSKSCEKSGRGRANVVSFRSWWQGSACATYKATKTGNHAAGGGVSVVEAFLDTSAAPR